MPGLADDRPHRTPATALFWRLFLLNALVFGVATGILAFSPATVSAPVAVAELSVLVAGWRRCWPSTRCCSAPACGR